MLVLLGHIGALITVSAWGTSFLSTKILMETGGFTPVEVYIYRFFAAYLILFLFTFRKMMSNNWRDELVLALCGICNGSLYFITENYALKLTTTSNVSLLASISPIFTTFLMALVYKQKIKVPVWIGSVVAFVGVAFVIFSNGFSIELHPAGDLLALTAAFCWGIYSVAIKRVIPLYNSFFITRKLFFYGVLSALPLLMMQHEPLHYGLLFDLAQPKYLLNFSFLVLMCSLAAYLLWNECTKTLGPVTANNYLYMQPIVTMIAAYFILGEQIGVFGYIGCVLIVGGLVVADKLKLGSDK